MKAILILLPACLACGFSVKAQCPEFQLPELQSLQRADAAQKESDILALGFDLRSTFELQGETIRNYSRCWYANAGEQPVFEQLIWWNQRSNSILFLTLNEAHFKALRHRIVERQSSGRITENPDFYVGKMFLYRFGVRRVEAAEYFFVQISFP